MYLCKPPFRRRLSKQPIDLGFAGALLSAMKTRASEYREKAAELRRRAEEDSRLHDAWLKVAEEWDKLADAAEAHALDRP